MKIKLLSMPGLAAQAEQYVNDAEALALVIKTLPQGQALRVGLTEAYVDGLRKIWLGMCIVAVFALISCVFGKEYTLDRKHEAQQVLGGPRDEKKAEADLEKGQSQGVSERTDEKKAKANPDKGQAEV
jgi:hypothetical protein